MVIFNKIYNYFAETFSPKALTKDKAKSGKSRWGIQILDPNPDDLITYKGQGVKIYQDMLREPYVKAALNNKKFEILAWPWTIEPGSEEQKDIDIAEELENDLRHLEGQTFSETLYATLDGLDCGYSIQEILMKQDGLVYRFRKFRSLDPYYYKFNLDAFGNILKVVADNVTGIIQQEEFDPRLFFIWSYNERYSNPFGNSDLRAAYRAYWIKDTAWKMRGLYMERYGQPTLVGKVPPGSHTQVSEQLLDVLKTIQAETAIVIEDDQAVEVVNYAASGITGATTEFERATKDLNKDILVGILGSFLSVEEGKTTGARSMGEVHEEMLKRAAQFVAKTLEDAVNEQLIALYLRLNIPGELENPPKFKFDRSQDFNRREEADVVAVLRKAGLELSMQEVRDKFGYRELEDGEETLTTATPASFGNPADEDEEEDIKADDTELIDIRERFRSRYEAILIDIASTCTDAVKKSHVIPKSDIVKAGSMKLPINVGKAKRALTDAMAYGYIIGMGGTIEKFNDIDGMLQEQGVSSEKFGELIREHSEIAERLAGRLQNELRRAFRSALMDIVANEGNEREVWARFHDIVTAELDNYVDAVDIEAFSLGYNDGLKAKHAN